MIYLSSFMLSRHQVSNPNLYPYNIFRKKYIHPFVFAPITVFYGNNGSGKSTILNIIAAKLHIEGNERYDFGDGGIAQSIIDRFTGECRFDYGCDDDGVILSIPAGSLYIKSEDILYEIKKIQQEEALTNGYLYSQIRKGRSKRQAEEKLSEYSAGCRRLDILKYAQEKYSNGETAMQMLMDRFEPDRLYLLDEPEVSLSPQNQVLLANEINKMARFLGCQFIIATHSPFMLGILNGKIYNLDSPDMEERKWNELENIRFFYDFFEQHKREFEGGSD